MNTNSKDKGDLTIVTGIWDLKRSEAGEGFKRPFSHYVENFVKLLKTDVNMYIYIEKEYEDLVWEHRSVENTYVHIKEVEEFKKFDFYDKVQEIRKSEEWLTATGSTWLRDSTQATLEFYNPMVMSKMFMLNDAVISNPFDTDYFAWIDGGITNTVHEGYFTHDKVFDKVAPLLKKFFFLCFPYETDYEIHGLPIKEMDKKAGEHVNRVARGGFFGGHKKYIPEVNAMYHGLLKSSIEGGLMGTEESIFSLMTYLNPKTCKYYPIEENGLISKFFEDLKNNDIEIESSDTNLYVVTFNFPDQLEYLLDSYKETGFLNETKKYLINNSTDDSTDAAYQEICDRYGFKHLKQEENIGICGARQYAAEHFAETNSQYMIFLEDDMLLKRANDSSLCQMGFTSHSENLYEKLLNIMSEEKYHFLKFSFTEFYGTNSNQWAWYNVPQDKREEYWPEYNKLPEFGLDPNCPLTNFKNIKSKDGLPYADGEIYYCNWPQIISKEGSKRMFLETVWRTPHEQTWMSHIFQLIKAEKVRGGILLASPIFHDRKYHYKAEERVESRATEQPYYLNEETQEEEQQEEPAQVITGGFTVRTEDLSGHPYDIMTMQNDGVKEVFPNFLEQVKPKRIVEIGTFAGGLTLLLRGMLDELGLNDTHIKTFEYLDSDFSHIFDGKNIESVAGVNIFDEEFNLIKSEYVDEYIKGDGTTVVLCDGGRKSKEFQQLSPLLKEGDIIMVHDYIDTEKNFHSNFKNKIWNWHEVSQNMLEEDCEKNNLYPFFEEEMKRVVWGCFRKGNKN